MNRQTQIGLTLLTSLIILGLIGSVYWWTTSNSTLNSPESSSTLVSSDNIDWPTTVPTFTPLPEATLKPTFTPTPTPTPKPPPPWHELGYLTTLEYTEKVIVEHERSRNIFSSERILLMTVGKVQTGIDLTQLDDDHVEINGRDIKITLPRAKIISVALIPNETKIFDREGTWLLANYDGLETEAITEAQRQLESSANGNFKMLELTEKVAKSQLENFLRQLEFENIEITFTNN